MPSVQGKFGSLESGMIERPPILQSVALNSLKNTFAPLSLLLPLPPSIAPNFPELLLQQIMAGHDAAVKVQGELFLFRFIELPVDAGGAESFDETGDREGEGHGDVEALGEAVHGDAEVAFRSGQGGGGEAFVFGPEEERDGLVDGQGGEVVTGLVRRGGDEPVAAGLERLNRGLGTVIAVQGEPLRAAHGDVVVRAIVIATLDDVDILQAEAVATAEAGAGVVGLVDVFEEDGEMTGPLIEDGDDLFPLVVSDVSSQEVGELLVGGHGGHVDGASGQGVAQASQRGFLTPM